jgi:hypothetical protein
MKSALGMVGAPAFMRGEERFSAPERVSPLIARFSAGAGTSQAAEKVGLYQGTTLVVP